MRLAYMTLQCCNVAILITNCKGSLYIGIINRIELLSSSVRVTSGKSQPKLLDGGRELETKGPIDRTPGSGKNTEIQKYRSCLCAVQALFKNEWGLERN